MAHVIRFKRVLLVMMVVMVVVSLAMVMSVSVCDSSSSLVSREGAMCCAEKAEG